MFISELFEDDGKTAVLTYGRFNPPTIGHAKLVDKLLSVPGDHFVVVSHTQDNKKNPLAADEKVALLKTMYPGKDVFIAASKENPTIITMAANLYKQGYKNLIIVVGADRVATFDDLFNQYNGKFNADGIGYKFNTIKVISAGERDPDADGAEGMSASKMREAAMVDDLEAFKTGLDPALHNIAPMIMGTVKERLTPVAKVKKVKEDIDSEEPQQISADRNAELCKDLQKKSSLLANAEFAYLGTKGALYTKGLTLSSIAKELQKLGWTKAVHTSPDSKVLVRADDSLPIYIHVTHANAQGIPTEIVIEFKEYDRVKPAAYSREWQNHLDTKGFE